MRDLNEIEKRIDRMPERYSPASRPVIPSATVAPIRHKHHLISKKLLLGLFAILGTTIIVSATSVVYISNQVTTNFTVLSQGVMVEQKANLGDEWSMNPISLSALIGYPTTFYLQFTNLLAPNEVTDTTLITTIEHDDINESSIQDIMLSIETADYHIKNGAVWLPGVTHTFTDIDEDGNYEILKISVAGVDWPGNPSTLSGEASITFSEAGEYSIVTAVQK